MLYTALLGIAKSQGRFKLDIHYKVLTYRVVHKWIEYESFVKTFLRINYVIFTLGFALGIFFYLLVLRLVTWEFG